MKRPLLIILVVLAALVGWDRLLARREARSRRASVRIQPLVAPALFQSRPVVALRLERPPAEDFLYIHQKGLWRCLSAHGAVALAGPTQELLQKLIEARGVVQGRVVEYSTNLGSFGLDTGHRLRISLYGQGFRLSTGGDLIYALDIGGRVPTTGSTYVHPADSLEIWAVDVDFRAGLENEGQSPIPPLLDPGLVPEAWPGARAGVRRITLERPAKPALQAIRRDRERSEEELRSGLPPWEWLVREGETESLGDTIQVSYYSLFLLHAPYVGLWAQDKRKELDFEHPRARLTLEADGGHSLQLVLAGRSDPAPPVILNTFTQSIYEVTPEVVAHLTPDKQMLLDNKAGNPWEQWLKH